MECHRESSLRSCFQYLYEDVNEVSKQCLLHLTTNWIEPKWTSRTEVRKYVKSLLLLSESTFEPVFLQLAMNIQNGLHIPLSSIMVTELDKAPDSLKLPKGIGDVAVKYPLICTKIWWLTRRVGWRVVSYSADYVAMTNAGDWPKGALAAMLKRRGGLYNALNV